MINHFINLLIISYYLHNVNILLTAFLKKNRLLTNLRDVRWK